MLYLVILNLLIIVALTQGALPSFKWDTSGNDTEDNLPIIRLIVDFNDNGPTDVAKLVRKTKKYATQEEQEKKNECILLGYLRHEAKVGVTVSGCPGATTFQVIMDSKRTSESVFEVRNGNVTAYQSEPNEDLEDDPVEFEEMKDWNIEMKTIQDRNLPNQFRLSIALRYDNLFLHVVCQGDHNLAQARAEEILDLAQGFYRMSDTLGTTIELEMLNVKHVDSEFILRKGETCDPMCTLSRAEEEFTALDPDMADNYHYLSYDIADGGVAGIARKMAYSSNGSPWQYYGSVCWPDKKKRTAITEVQGEPSTSWDILKLGASGTFAHELGHSLGMPHDFLASSTSIPRLDSNGQSCLQVDGIMSYKSTKTTWSQCSKEAIKGWFDQLSSVYGLNCKVNECKDVCSSTSLFECPIQSNDGEKVFICDQPSQFGGCNGNYKEFFDDYCQKTCGLCQDFASTTLETTTTTTTTTTMKTTKEPNNKDICINLQLKTGFLGRDISWKFGSCESSQKYQSFKTYNISCCQPPGIYELDCMDVYGSGWFGSYIQVGGSPTKWCKNFDWGRSLIILVRHKT